MRGDDFARVDESVCAIDNRWPMGGSSVDAARQLHRAACRRNGASIRLGQRDF